MGEQYLRKLIEAIFAVHQDGGIDCDTCSAQFDCLVEKVAAGAALRELLPEVEAHLECCNDCREEYEALLAIIRAENGGQLAAPLS
jgi:predicted anti-sigma-YlaC factor YlaD